MPTPDPPEALDYAAPLSPPKWRDSIEYYREPPISAHWGPAQLVILAICLIAAGIGCCYLLSYLVGLFYRG